MKPTIINALHLHNIMTTFLILRFNVSYFAGITSFEFSQLIKAAHMLHHGTLPSPEHLRHHRHHHRITPGSTLVIDCDHCRQGTPRMNKWRGCFLISYLNTRLVFFLSINVQNLKYLGTFFSKSVPFATPSGLRTNISKCIYWLEHR